MNAPVFLPGSGETTNFPLGRFLPPVSQGTTSDWLKENVPAGAWLVDPIGFAPLMALEACQAGYRILVSCNNPILSLMYEVLAAAPDKNQLKSVLAELSLLKRGEERLDTHLQSLYLTSCPSCKQTIQAQGYLWKRGEKEPYARHLLCPRCGTEGEFPPTEEDITRLAPPGNPALHRARAIERVSLQDDDIRPGVEEALRAYLPRALYFITTLINKIEGGEFTSERRKILWALVLSACDEGNSLWPWPAGRARPRQISIPPQFRENNLWASLEAAVETWSLQTQPVRLSIWPDLPPEDSGGGICLYRGRLKSILPLPAALQPKAAITVFPRPSQAFWTLSAVWSGWLWGREAVQPLKSALDRLRYDWDWHATALYNSFEALHTNTPEGFPFFGIMPETVPGFLGALVLAAETAKFHLGGLALREDDTTTQLILHHSNNFSAPKGKISPAASVEKTIFKFLEQTREPAAYLPLYAAAFEGAAAEGLFTHLVADNSGKDINSRYFSILSNRFEEIFHQIIRNPRSLVRFGGSEQNEESGFWWLRTPPPSQVENDAWLPLADQIEKELVQYLQRNPKSRFTEIQSELYRRFPGLLTPGENFLRECLESYGQSINQDGVLLWQLRPEDIPSSRRRDLQDMQGALCALSVKLNLICSGNMPVQWETPAGKVVYAFYPLASSIISRWLLLPNKISPERCVVILPGGRARLLAYKLRRDPRLAELTHGWHFLKFRGLRKFLEQPTPDISTFNTWLDSDPPDLDEPRQMSIFDT